MELVRNFTKLSKHDAPLAGGKGASLGEMTQAGIPVPPGFVVLSESFEQFIRETDLVQEIDTVLHKVNHKEIHTVEAASEKIRDLILNVEMPKDIAKEIKKSFKELNTKYVAVRSSATAEDGKDHAWAGQLESYLNTTENQVLTKVKLCWSSLFTPRAIFYRFEKGLHSTKISVAVVVQKMVESEVSGIAFSVHPVTEDHNQLIIEAGFGLGEAIVSGSVTPDAYVVEKEPRRILDINVSTQERGLYRGEVASLEHGNNEWRDIREPKASSQVLDEKQILELSEIIIGIENHYGFPCDIEWAFEKGKFYIVQSRPITTLQKKVEIVKKKSKIDIHTDSSYPISYKSEKLNWIKFLERKRTPFIYFPFIEIESQRMPELCGYRFYHHLFKWSDTTGVHFREVGELEKNNAFILNLIKNKDPRVKKWAQKGLEVQGLADKWLKEFSKKPKTFSIKVFDQFYEDFIQILLYTATMPYLVLSAIDGELTKGEKREEYQEILALYEPLRNTSKYPELERTILNPWFDELGKKFNIDPIYIHFLTPTEIRNLDKEGIDKEELRKRKEWSLFWNDIETNKITFTFDKSIMKSIPVLDEKIESTNALKGTVAYPGKAQGKVRIVNILEDGEDFHEGDILVSLNTNPDLVPIIKKAAAIVTDEGGIMCHAAIVSREFKIPCVIGTKNATKVLKDGDMVEVDADAGIVKILKTDNFLSNEEWIFMWSSSPIMPAYWSTCETRDRPEVYGNEDIFSYYENGIMTTYTPQWVIDNHKTGSKKFLNQKYYSDYVKKYIKESEIWWKWIRNIEKKDYVKINKKELINDIEKFRIYARDSMAYFGSTRPEFTFSIERRLEEILKKVYKNWPEIFGILATSTLLDDIQKEYLAWLSLIESNYTDKDLIAHASKYPWLIFGQFDDEKILSYLREKARTTHLSFKKESKRLAEEKRNLQIKHNKIFEKLKEDRIEAEYYSKLLQEQSVRRMDIKSYWAGSYFLTRKMWIRISELLNSNITDILSFITPPEIVSLLQDPSSFDIQSIITDRKISHSLIIQSNKIVILGSDESKKLFKDRIKKVQEGVKEIKGQVAMLGKIKGKVRKVIAGDLDMLQNSIKEFQKGEILVTSMTQPNMMVIAERAAAIITDEGGITSHAAIIARELKVPCIVGCLHAMEVLNDGDIVEVDAEKGIVRILE